MISKTSNPEFLKIYMDIIEELRDNGKIFSQQNPDLAPYLDLSFRRSNDPETERLIESFAYMFAQVEHKSYLTQNDYVLNFIEHIFPELILPIPALTVLKITPDISVFNKNKIKFNLPKLTKFSTKNKNNLDCNFISTQDMPISCFNIVNTCYIDSLVSKENIYGNKKAFIIDFESSLPVEVSKKMNDSLSIYIDSDFYSSILIYEAIFSSKNPMIILADDNQSPIFLSKENISPIYDFESEDKKNNLLYPMFDFLNYFQKYLFIKIILNQNFQVNKKFKLIIPINNSINNISRFGNNFLKLNCIPVKNYFIRQIDPIKCMAGIYEYNTKIDEELSREMELLSFKSLKIYTPSTGEAFSLPPFHRDMKEFYIKNENFYKLFYWSTKRSFNETKKNSSLSFRLISNDKYDVTENDWPEYLFPTGYFTNGLNAEYITPLSSFYCHSSQLAIESSHSLFWPKFFNKPLKNLTNCDILKFIYVFNQDLLTKRLFNANEFEKLLDYLTHNGNPVKNLLIQILSHSIGIKQEETTNSRIWKNQSYNLPGMNYKILFNQKDGFPHGVIFLVNFLNFYFDYIKEFNFLISFEAELV